MTDINGTDMSLRSVFAKKAELPKKEILNAELFLSAVHSGSVSPTEVKKSGERILKNLQEQKELYAFHATLAASELNETELEHKIESIGKALEKVETTVEKLKNVLSFSAATA